MTQLAAFPVWTVPLMPSRLPSLDAERLERLEAYLGLYRDVFGRADQARLFGLYVRGLLDGDHRKNVESIAGRVGGAEDPAADLAQSLQHFVTQSPWDAGKLIARYRGRLTAAPHVDRTWVVHDGVIPKKGRFSVGVQRQFARSLGRKVNCQLAVVVSEVHAGADPLAARLYLPAYWLRENRERAERTVPDTHRQGATKPEIALALLAELLAERPAAAVIAEDGYATAPQFVDGLAARGLTLVPAAVDERPALRAARDRFDWLKETLGLSHFEGRTWAGWHHHLALVLAAYGFLRRDPELPRFSTE